jgi:hypothetical protein
MPHEPSLAVPDPGMPVVECSPGDTVRIHLAAGADKPRNHSLVVHGHTWPMEAHLHLPRLGAIGGISTGTLRTLTFTAGSPGDHAYRPGVLRWHLTEGLWGLIRVRE